MQDKKYNLSVIVSYDIDDIQYLNDCLATIPSGCEILLIQNIAVSDPIKILRPDFNIEIKSTTELNNGSVLIQGCLWYFKNGNVNNFSFSRALNSAIQHCTSDWILKLDADERLTFPKSLLDSLKDMPESLGGLRCKITNWSKHATMEASAAFMSDSIRLFRNNPKIRWKYHAHEEILPALTLHRFLVVDSHYHIFHLGYRDDKQIIASKLIRNFYLNCKDVLDEPVNVRNMQLLYKSLTALKDLGVFQELKESFNVNISGN